MALKAYRGRQFDHTHENKAFNRLYDVLSDYCQSKNQEWHLLANFYVGGREIDALVIKSNAIVIIDFKEFSGTLQFSESGPWMMEVEPGNSVQVKGGASINPLRQLTINKRVMIEFMDRNMANLDATCNWRHIAAMVAFQGIVEYDPQQLPGGIKPWFFITDNRALIRDLDAIVSKQIALLPDDIQRIVAHLGIDPYVPAWGPEVRVVGADTDVDSLQVTFTTRQNELLQEFRTWLQSTSGAFRVSGMASTGKRYLFPHLIEAIKDAGREAVLLAPSARLSGNYCHPLAVPTSIYTWLYTKEPSRFEDYNERKIGIHDIRKDLYLTGVIPVLVDAHLLSDEEFDIKDRRYGSGRLIQDFLSVIKEAKAPFVIIGDPYQTPRGSLQRSLMNNSLLEQHQLLVSGTQLTEQIVMDAEDALSRFQSELVGRLINERFNLLPRTTGNRLQIHNSDNKTIWSPDVSNVQAESMLLCATHEQTSKINAAVKTRILGHKNPVRLAKGDRIDFYNRTPIIPTDDEEYAAGELRWISAGEVGLIDDVDGSIESHSVELRGRKEPTRLHFQLARCRLPGLGEVRFRYLVDYFESDRAELSSDQILALQVRARQIAGPALNVYKKSLPDKKDPKYKAARADYDRIEYQLLQAQGYASAALIRPAHAMTLHRAQGRRWPCIWVNASRSASSEKANNSEYFRWLYTSTTIAEELLVLRQMPDLTPLSYASVSRGHDLHIGAFPFKKGLYYDVNRTPTEQEAAMSVPEGFKDIALLPLLLTLQERLAPSSWHITRWQEYSFQVVIVLSDPSQASEVTFRLHYDKKFTVTNMVFTDGSQADQSVVENLIRIRFRAASSALQDALEAITLKLAINGFELVEAKESNYRLQLVFHSADDAIDIQVNADKEGMVSSIRINRASSEEVIARFTKAMEAQS